MDSKSVASSSAGSTSSAVGFEADSATDVGFALGFCFGNGSITKGCARPTILQSTEGNF